MPTLLPLRCLPFLCVVKLFGCSAAAQVKTSRETKGQFLSVNMAFSVGVMSAMYLTKNITGISTRTYDEKGEINSNIQLTSSFSLSSSVLAFPLMHSFAEPNTIACIA